MYRLYYNNLVRRLAFGLPAELWIVSVGIFLNSLGWAAVLPFEIIYLHDGRGFSLGDAGFVAFDYAYVALVAAAVVVGVGECFYTAVLSPLVADLAPPALRGRYMATIGLSWWLGLALAPTAGAQLLSVSPAATLLVAAGVALAAGASALGLERDLPSAVRLTPRPTGPR